MLQVRGVISGYRRRSILDELSLSAQPGQVTALLGGNGAGKSTLLKTIAGVIRASRGSIRFCEIELVGLSPLQCHQAGVGLLLQRQACFPGLSVDENLRLARCLGVQPERRPPNPFPVLHRLSSRPAALLSGGERRMLEIAMILQQEPRLLLLDEPSAGLSAEVTRQCFEAIDEYTRERGTVTLLVEQNVGVALECAAQVYVLRNGRAREIDASLRQPENLLAAMIN